MKYFLDTEFLEGTQTKRVLGIPIYKTPPTIDLISIGIVSEDGREYYAISNEFNLPEAWNRDWLKPNVLRPIFNELCERDDIWAHGEDEYFTYKNFKSVIKKYGKTKKQISEEVKRFIYNPESVKPLGTGEKINFYGYYAEYDWVVFCWLFGRMVDLPKLFPMYCIDLKQLFDNHKVNKDQLLKEVPQINSHNSLEDARWNFRCWEWLEDTL